MLTTLTCLTAAALTGGCLSGPLGTGADEMKPADITPKLVKLKELIAAIQAHKGKIVVVDFWADF